MSRSALPRVVSTVAALVAVACLSTTACGSGTPSSADAGRRSTTSSSAESDPTTDPTTGGTGPTSAPPPTETTTTTAPPPPPKSAVAPVFPPSPTPPRPVDAATPVRIHTLGDSTAFSIGWGVARAAGASGLATATVDARTSTGLTRNDYFDWPAHLLGLVVAPPEVAVVSFGANDSQPLTRPDSSVVAFDAPGWREEYGRRVEGVMTLLTGLGVRVYWVGQPIARDPGYTDRMRVLDDVYRDVVGRFPDATYVDATYWLSDDAGGYTDVLPGPDGAPVGIRDDDGIHLSTSGGDFLGAVVLNQILADHGVAR